MPLERLSILLVDNDEAMLAAVSTRLSALRASCVCARTGGQALSIYKERAFDLVITDLNMPGGDGITLARSIRDSGSTPVLIMTGFRERFQSMIDSIDGVRVLRKPFTNEQLVREIQGLLGKETRPCPDQAPSLVELHD